MALFIELPPIAAGIAPRLSEVRTNGCESSSHVIPYFVREGQISWGSSSSLSQLLHNYAIRQRKSVSPAGEGTSSIRHAFRTSFCQIVRHQEHTHRQEEVGLAVSLLSGNVTTANGKNAYVHCQPAGTLTALRFSKFFIFEAHLRPVHCRMGRAERSKESVEN